MQIWKSFHDYALNPLKFLFFSTDDVQCIVSTLFLLLARILRRQRENMVNSCERNQKGKFNSTSLACIYGASSFDYQIFSLKRRKLCTLKSELFTHFAKRLTPSPLPHRNIHSTVSYHSICRNEKGRGEYRGKL